MKKYLSGSEDFRDVDLMLFTKALVFDHYRQKLILISGVDTSDIEASYQKAEEELEEMKKLLNSRMITKAAANTVMLIKAVLTMPRSITEVEVT